MTDLDLFRNEICAVIVTFHPDDQLEERVTKILRQSGCVIMVDNNSSQSEIQMMRAMVLRLKKCYIIENGSNLGIAEALNIGVEFAKNGGYKSVLLFDQDTVIEDNMLESIYEVYEAFPHKEKVAVIGSNFIDTYTRKNVYGDESDKSTLWLEMLTVITSGSFIPLDVFNNVGLFRSDFFIDHVDDEFCLRAKHKGYKILLTRKETMKHSFGAATMHKFLWRRAGTSNHSPIRRYYMTRNHIVLIKEYFTKEPGWVIETVITRFKSLILMILFEEKRCIKLKAMLKGLMHGLFQKTLKNW
ncbi:MAG TPA: glycosyltransferase family 2 protein [Pseudobacteroides sp.]|uniref:glycosyltransferase family 2 protein n=1 Tax=Pseudobacteroides sp. TaxID=1968840 RepID=UPI002F940596